MMIARLVVMLAGAALLAALGSAVATSQDSTEKEVERYRQMLRDDPWSNPGNLDVDRGESLWKQKRGPLNASLEACDLGKGAGKLDGAFAELPRYFADADRVMDVEARIVWCKEKLQGLKRPEIVRPYPPGGQPATDLAAVVTFVASKSQGMKFSVKAAHPREQEMLVLGEALFNRRWGPFDFSCATCHADAGKRIRLQGLPYLSRPEEARKVIGEWPAYRVSSTHVMTMQHRIYDCFWQMRMPQVELGSDVSIALTLYLVRLAEGGTISAPSIKR